jgi:succinyl-CoA synthetase alpha subunit
MLGPNCPGALSPGKANVGIIPAEVFARADRPRQPLGTLTYQIGYELAQRGLGNSTIVGIGGDPSSARRSSTSSSASRRTTRPTSCHGRRDRRRRGGEGGALHRAHMSKPVVAYIAGFTAPPGKTMGHAGAIITGSSAPPQAKKEALEARGVKVGTTPTEVAELARTRPALAPERLRPGDF